MNETVLIVQRPNGMVSILASTANMNSIGDHWPYITIEKSKIPKGVNLAGQWYELVRLSTRGVQYKIKPPKHQEAIEKPNLPLIRLRQERKIKHARKIRLEELDTAFIKTLEDGNWMKRQAIINLKIKLRDMNASDLERLESPIQIVNHWPAVLTEKHSYSKKIHIGLWIAIYATVIGGMLVATNLAG